MRFLTAYHFNESELEQAVLEYFQELYYDIQLGPEISPGGAYPERDDYDQVILQDRLMNALCRINPTMPNEALEDAYRQVVIAKSPSLIVNNKEFYRFITDGVNVEVRRPDGSIKTDKVWLFDFSEAGTDNNDWLAVNQYTVIDNHNHRRPDVIVFINGIPLAVVELKSSSDENVGISEAFRQFETYKNEIPSLFIYNSFLVISDGVNAKAGTLTANEDWFMPWRTIMDPFVKTPFFDLLVEVPQSFS